MYLLNIYNRLVQNKTGGFQFDWKIFIDNTEEYSDSFITSNGWGDFMSASHIVQTTSPDQVVSVKASVPSNSSTTAVANRRTLVVTRIG